MKRVAVLQSNYIPWKGYFDLIHSVDEFVWYDDVQYTKHDWRNRNRIKTPRGVRWLTIPCQAHGKPRIDQVRIADPRWAEKHWRILTENYADAPFFARYRDDLEALYFGQRWEILAELNRTFIKKICRDYLGITTHFLDSADFELHGSRQERLLDLLEQVGAEVYLTGLAALAYIDGQEFQRRGIEVEWMSQDGYPAYPQLHGDFAHQVSILDLLFQVGERAPWYIWGWRDGTAIG